MKRATIVLALLVLALGLALPPAADARPPESNNAVSGADTAATTTFTRAHKSVHVTNDGSAAVWVRIWGCDETPATITTATNGARKVTAGEGWGLEWDSERVIGDPNPGTLVGFCAISYITDTGTSTTFRLFAY